MANIGLVMYRYAKIGKGDAVVEPEFAEVRDMIICAYIIAMGISKRYFLVDFEYY